MAAADSPPAGAAPGALDRGRSWPYSLGLALAATLASPWLLGLFDGTAPIRRFPDRAIGRVVLEGVDASGYVHNYVLLWAALIGLFLLASWALVRLRDGLLAAAGEDGLGAEFRGLARLNEISVALLVLRLWFGDERFLNLKGLVDRALVLLLLFAVARVVALRRRPRDRVLLGLLARSDLVVVLLFLPAPVVFGGHLLLGRPLLFGDGVLAVWLVLAALPFTAGYLALRRSARGVEEGREEREVERRIDVAGRAVALAAAPLVLAPLAFPVGNEIQSLLRSVSPRLVVGLLGLVLVAASGGLLAWWWRARRRGGSAPGPSAGALLVYFYYPALVVTVATFASHVQVWVAGALDYFHYGEKVMPVQQLFQFGALPQVDLRLTHSFSDVVYGALYAWLSGDVGLDTLLWGRWIPGVVALLVLYFLVARVVRPGFAVLACCLLPVTGLASSYYAPALVPALFLAHAVARPSWQRWLLVWLSAAGVLLWRIDFGLAAGVALALAAATFLLRASRRHWRQVALSLAAFVGGSALLFVASSLLLRLPLFDTASRLVASYTTRLVTRTRSQVIDGFGLAAAVQYYLLPAVAAVHLGYLALQRWVRRLRLPPQHYPLLYLAAFCLVMSVRSMERHSLVEQFNPYCFGLLLALTPALAWRPGRPREGVGARAVFLGVVVASGLFVLPPAEWVPTPNPVLRLASGRPLFTLHHWRPGEPRVVTDSVRHRPLVELLDAHLRDDQTFYDFTNSPLLYAFAEREFPTWVIPNLVQTSEGVQRQVIADLHRLLEADRLPLVVFDQGGGFWDNADGVPNEVRSYRIAELVYRHYRPWLRVAGYELWHRVGEGPLPPPPDPEGRSLEWRADPRTHDLRVLAGDGALRVEAGEADPYVHRFVDLAPLPDLAELEDHWLRLEVRSSAAGTLEIRFATDGRFFDPSRRVSVEVEADSGEEPEVVFAPLAAAGAGVRWTDLRLDPPAGATFAVLRAEVVRRPVEPLDEPADVEQWFELEHLPRVWAELDPLEARSRTRVLRTLQEEPRALRAGGELAWDVEPGFDRSRGNYLHLRLRPLPVSEPAAAPGDGRLEVRYGPRLEDGFAFRIEPEERARLPRGGEPELHRVTPFPVGDRTAYEATGSGAWMGGILETRGLPAEVLDDAVALDLGYRARGDGALRVEFVLAGEGGERVVTASAPLASTESSAGPEQPRRVRLPIRREGVSGRLADLRLHLPTGALFEIVTADLVTAPDRDHLVRTSTQWKWWALWPHTITLRSDVPVRVEGAWIRSGD